MAERTVSVRLLAKVDQYQAAMRQASASTTKLVQDGQVNFARLGSQMQNVGRDITRYATVPLLAVGTGAVAMASRFESAFAQMQGLAGITAGEVDGLRDSVLSLAGRTAVAPQQLADALYFASSAGLDTADAMEAVEAAAMASASGMGTAGDVVGLVASALSSYGSANIDAAEATDILTATIRAGRAEPAELAGTLGRVLPVAAALGVSFEDVGGATAYLSNVFGDTGRTVTSMSGILNKLLAPTQQGRQALLDMGTSLEELHAAIDERGLLGALDLLRDHGFAGNQQALRALFDDVEAFQGALALVNDESGSLTATFAEVQNSAGALGEAFAITAQTDGFQMRQALVDIQTAMIELGDVLLPIAAGIASAIGDVAQWFGRLDPEVQKVVATIGALVAAGGPAIFMAGTLVKNWQTLTGAMGSGEGAVARATRGLGLLAVGVGAAKLAFDLLGEGHLNSTAHIDTASDALARQTAEAWRNAEAAGEAETRAHGLAIANVALANAISESADPQMAQWLSTFNVAANDTLDVLVGLRDDGNRAAFSMELLRDRFGLTEAQARLFRDTVMGFGFEEQDITQELRDGLGMTNDEILMSRSALAGLQQYIIENAGEIDNLARATLDAQVRLGGVGREAVIAAEGLAGSRLEAGNAVAVYEEFVIQLTAMDPASAAAVVGLDELASSAAASADGARDAAVSAEELNAALEVLGVRWQRAAVMDRFWEAPRAGMAELAERAGHTGFEMLVLQEAVMKAAATGEDMRDVLIEQALAFGRNEQQAGLLADMLGPAAEAMLTVYEAAAQSNGELGKQIPIVDKLASSFRDAETALKGLSADPASTGWMKGVADSLERIGSVRLVGIADATSIVTSFADVMDRARGRADDFRRALDNLTNPHIDLVEAQAAVREMMGRINSEVQTGVSLFNEHTGALNLDSDAVRANVSLINDAVGLMQDEAAGQIARGEGIDVATQKLASNTEEFIENMVAAGMNRDELIRYLASINALPEDAVTTIELIGQEYAKQKVNDFKNALAGVPASKGTVLYASADKSGIDSFKYALAGIPSSKTVRILTTGSTGLKHSATGRFVPGGTNMVSTLGELPGRRGDELVLPLGDPHRMSALLGMPEVLPRVVSALGAGSGGSSTTVTHGDTIIDVRVFNNGRDLSGSDVARAIMREMASA